MSFARTIVNADRNSQWHLVLEGDTISVRPEPQKAAQETSCGSLFQAVSRADAEEWQQLAAGGQLVDAATASIGGGPPSLKPLWHGDLRLLLDSTPAAIKARKAQKLNLYDLVEYAASRLCEAWRWDNPARAAELTQQATPELLALWAILNVDGQVCNGGFNQLFYNSYGELAEQALQGFALFGMHDYVRILEQAYAIFPERPITANRAQRIELLEAMTYDGDGEPPASIKSARQPLAYFSALAQSNRERWDALETEYYGLIDKKIAVPGYNSAFYLPLCVFIAEHQEAFFQIPGANAPKA